MLKSLLSRCGEVSWVGCAGRVSCRGIPSCCWGALRSGRWPGLACELAPGFIERRCAVRSRWLRGDGDQFLCHGDVVPGQLDDVGDLLPEDQDEDRCCAVPRVDVGRCGLGCGRALLERLHRVLGWCRGGGACSFNEGSMRLVLIAQSRKRCRRCLASWGLLLAIGPGGLAVSSASSVSRSVSQFRSSIATVTACLARRNVPWVTSSIWFIRRWWCQRM